MREQLAAAVAADREQRRAVGHAGSRHSASSVWSTSRVSERIRRDAAGAVGRAAAKCASSAALPRAELRRAGRRAACQRPASARRARRASAGEVLGSADEGGRGRAAGRKRHHLVAGVGDEDRVLPLRRQRAVFRDDGPAVAHLADLAPAGVDHRLDREHHARHQLVERAGAAVVQHLRLLVELAADAVAAELAHDRKAVALGEGLDRVADVAEAHARPDLDDALPHRVVRHAGFRWPYRPSFMSMDIMAVRVDTCLQAVGETSSKRCKPGRSGSCRSISSRIRGRSFGGKIRDLPRIAKLPGRHSSECACHARRWDLCSAVWMGYLRREQYQADQIWAAPNP